MRVRSIVVIGAASALAVAVLSGCSSNGSEQDASAHVTVGVCAIDTPSTINGVTINSGRCAVTVNNESSSMRAYTVDLVCVTASRGTFDAGHGLYYVSPGQHVIPSDGTAIGGDDQSLNCHLGSATVRNLTVADGTPDPEPLPEGPLASALAAAAPVDTAAAAAAASASAAADASASAAAAASASASASASAALAALQQRALARTYKVGWYSITFSNPDPEHQFIELLAEVTSNDPDTGMAKPFGLDVTFLNADGSVNATGKMCGETLGGGDTNSIDFVPGQGTTSWTTIRVSKSATTTC